MGATPTPAGTRATVIGTGAMGPEIAAALAAAGLEVTIAGRDRERAAAARERAIGLLDAPPAIASAALGPAAVAGSGLVVESVVEDLVVKGELLGRVEGWCGPEALIATNTSSLRIGDLAAGMAHPGRVAGLHFLKPAHLTAVVEVVPGPATSDATVDALRGLAARMGKAPLVARGDAPGFIWNRIQFAVLRECLHMLEAGVADAADIDAAVANGLAPRWMAAGPLATADLGGLRTFAIVCAQLFPELSDADDVPGLLADLAAEGGAFAPWTASGGPGVGELRARALAMGREIAARRRELGG